MNGKKEAEVVVVGRETEREEEVLQFCTAQGRGRGSEVDALSGGRYLKMCAVRKKGGSCRKVYSVDTQDTGPQPRCTQHGKSRHCLQVVLRCSVGDYMYLQH